MRLLLLFLIPSLASAANWDNLINQSGGSKVFFGVALEGPDPFRRNFSDSFAPASNSKLLTSVAALDLLGPDFRYPTVMRWKQIDTTATALNLTGYGDPSWGMSEFKDGLEDRVNALAQALFDSGIREVQGAVEVKSADPGWDEISFPYGWKTSDPLTCGGAIAQAFTLNINCASLVVSGTSARWREPGVPTRVEMAVKTGKQTRLTLRLIGSQSNELGYRVEGTIKKGATQTYFIPVWNSRAWVKNLFTAALIRKGIRVNERIVPSAGEQKELVSYSRPLSELIRPFMKNSINVMGDAFLKTLAVHQEPETRPNLLSASLIVLRDYLLKMGVPDEFVIYDGSGLSRLSRITPRAMLSFLEISGRSPDFRALWNSLPVAGVDGTLRNRMKSSAAAGVLRAKTGTLDGVYNIAGYVPDRDGFVPFLMLTKTTVAHASTARSAQDRVGIALARLLPKPRSDEGAPYEPFPYVPEHAGLDDQ